MSDAAIELPDAMFPGTGKVFLVSACQPARGTGIAEGEWVVARVQQDVTDGVAVAWVGGVARLLPHREVPAGAVVAGKAVAVIRSL